MSTLRGGAGRLLPSSAKLGAANPRTGFQSRSASWAVLGTAPSSASPCLRTGWGRAHKTLQVVFLLDGELPAACRSAKQVGNTNTTYKVFHQRRLCDLLPRKKAFHWKPKVSGVCISSQMLNLAFQWMANLSVEKGFGVTAQSLLPAEGAFARKADYPIPQPVQRESQKSLAGLPIPQLVQCPNQNTPCEQGVFWFGLK